MQARQGTQGSPRAKVGTPILRGWGLRNAFPVRTHAPA